mmetsp:Transcript_16904/g.49792  ORF Transcript_16904/g.49792 Transcript_16904/m.49792 type:complete len:219 (+) Transcript_16904:467-1123(+)
MGARARKMAPKLFTESTFPTSTSKIIVRSITRAGTTECPRNRVVPSTSVSMVPSPCAAMVRQKCMHEVCARRDMSCAGSTGSGGGSSVAAPAASESRTALPPHELSHSCLSPPKDPRTCSRVHSGRGTNALFSTSSGNGNDFGWHSAATAIEVVSSFIAARCGGGGAGMSARRVGRPTPSSASLSPPHHLISSCSIAVSSTASFCARPASASSGDAVA